MNTFRAPVSSQLVSIVAVGASPGVHPLATVGVHGLLRLPTESVGSCQLTIDNIVVGSRYRVEVASTGALVAEGDATASTVVLNVPLYPTGNSSNTLRVKVRKGTTAPKYQPFQTQVIANAAGVTAYISQVPDPIA